MKTTNQMRELYGIELNVRNENCF